MVHPHIIMVRGVGTFVCIYELIKASRLGNLASAIGKAKLLSC